MYGCFCIGFIDFMLAGKKLTDLTSLFSQYDFKKNDDKLFQRWMKLTKNLSKLDKILTKSNKWNWRLFSSRD